MSRSPISRHLFIAALGVALLLALPAGASAGTKSATTTLPGGSAATGSATATCGHGQTATGGGFRAPAFDTMAGTVWVVVFESRKIGQRSWRASGFEVAASAVPLTVFAYCSKDAPKTKEKSSTVALAGGSPVPLTPAEASCGGAGKAQAGGFLIPTISPVTSLGFIIDSFRAGSKSWRSRAENGGGTPALTSYAYCAKTGAPKARTGSASSATDAAKVTAVSSKCKHGTAIAAGGFSQPNATPIGLTPTTGNFFFPWESFSASKRWQTSALHDGNISTTLNSIAYCA